LEAPTHFEVGETSLLKATVGNIGHTSVNGSVELDLLIGDNVVNSTVQSELDVGVFYEITFLWTPATAGEYTLKVCAPALVDEEYTVNNAVIQVVSVVPTQLPTIQVVPSRTQDVRVGELVRIYMKVYDVNDLFAWQAKLSFDSSVLEFRGIWLPDDHVFSTATYISPHPIVENGNVTFGAALIGATPSFHGTGTLMVIDFKALTTGYSLFRLEPSETFLLDSQLNNVPTELVNSGVFVFGDHIQIVSVNTTETQVYMGRLILVNVTTRNNGNIPQGFMVTVYLANELKVTQQVSNLLSGEEKTITFSIDTSTLTPYVHYAIWAEAGIVIDETYAYNNYYFLWTMSYNSYYLYWGAPRAITTRITPDINGDKRVDFRDIGIAAMAFGSSPGSPKWNLWADMNEDGNVNLKDVALVAKGFGKRYP
jgi:hypothetical protein